MRNLATDPLRVAVIGLGRWGFTLGGVAAKTPGLALTTCASLRRCCACCLGLLGGVLIRSHRGS